MAAGICGASAAMAISTVLPESEARQRQTFFTVIGVRTFSTVATVFYPIVGDFFNFSSADMGLSIGATIHDVAQGVGAGYRVSPEISALVHLREAGPYGNAFTHGDGHRYVMPA